MSAQLISERMLRDQVLGSLDWIEQKRRLPRCSARRAVDRLKSAKENRSA